MRGVLIYLQMLESVEDKNKFERLYTRYRGLMFYVAMGILHNESDAEDAVHQAFLSILNNLKKISDPDCPKTRAFVVIIAERKAIDLLRRRARLAETELDEETQGIPIPPEDGDALSDAMARLSARYREALLLRYAQGYRTGEVAELLGIGRAAAEKLLWRAKQALKKLLEEGETDA